MLELYYGKGSCAMAVHIALIESGLEYKLHSLDLAKGEQKGQEFLKINPKGYVPALKTDKGVLTEAQVLLQYIADQKPDKKLFVPPGGFEHYQAREWLNFVSTEMHKSIGAYFRAKNLDNPQSQADWCKTFDAYLQPRYEYLNQHLSKNTYLLGEHFSVADAYLFTVMNWTKFFKIDLSKYPALMGFMEKVAARPSVQKAMKEEGLIQ